MRKRTTSFVRLLIFTLLTLSTGAVWGQVTINSVIAQSPVDFAGNSDFSVGELTVSFNMPTGKTSGELQVNLAAGIEYMSGTVTATGATVSLKTGSTDANKPVFTLTGASGSVTVKFKRKATKAVLTNPALAVGLQDEAVLTVQGLSPSPAVKNVSPYQLPRPTLAVQLPTTQTDVLGARTETFDIRNTGNGIVKDVYFSIAYDHRDVVGLSVSHNGTPLTQVGTVPTGLPNAGKPIYKIANANLANNGVVTITEKYTVNKCTTGRQNTYYAYWGSGIANSNDIFETNSNTRNISVSTGIPIIRHSDNSAFNYFKWQDGFCGNILGTYYVRFNNETADPKGTAYNVEVKLFDGDPTIGFSVFEPINIRLVATDGTEIPISATGTGDTRFINFTNLAAVSNASLGTKNVGFTDEDGDGFKDDLKKGAYFQIAFDLKRKQSFQCLQPGKGPKNYFSLQPRAYVLYDNVCKGERDSSDLRLIDYGTMRIYFNGVNDASKLPAQLVENVPSAGYIAPGMNWPSLGIHQRAKNEGSLSDNERQFKYVITTPAGVKLQNVKLYRKTNIFGASPTTPVNQPDIEAGTTVTITTTNTPAYRDLTSGYLSFDALLQSCNGATAPITYSVYLMVKNGDGTYCDIPLVCNQVTNIPTICSTSCTIQGPRMLSTKVERADNSYGWKDYTMAVRQTRANVSSIERMRALYLDDIEFISEGQQHTGKSATNLFYYAKVENTAKLEPKKITLKVNGGAEQTFTATPNNPMRGTDAAGKNYFRWNLTSLFPTGILPAGATFTAVATYQVKNNNPTNSNERTMDIQSGIESFFYTLDNPATDVTISTEGYHTAEKHCGANLTPIFYIAETQSMLATNEYKEFSGCNIVELGGNLIYAARRFKSGGTYFSQEFRPARLTKKITIKMPSAYRINNIKYTYTYKIAEAAKEATVDMSRLTVIDDGTWKTYTYINPPKGTTGHLPPGMITVVNDYNEYLKVFIQPSCKAKTVDGNKTYWDQGLDAKAMNEMVSSNIEYEDYYYHYAETGNSAIAIDKLNDRPILFAESKKPEITIEPISQLTVKANKRVMEATFKLKNIKEYDAPFGWISVPDVTGIEVLSLEEGGHTYTAQNSISGEKMFFLSEKGNDGKILKNTNRQFKLKYKVTNCAVALQLKVYAGWNCNGNPTTGYRNTCSDKFITYNITVAQSKKEIRADTTNPGESNPDKKGSIPMCMATPYSYVINSADEGDLYDAKLVVTPANGITFSDIQVEYPLNSGKVYNTNTPVDGKIIGHTTLGSKHIYDLSSVLPDGSLPGSISEPTIAEKRQLKLTFKVRPDCEFSAGSSFDIDIEGNNLCGSPAEGDKTKAIIAGITGANVPDYGVQITMDKDLVGNLSSCGNSQKIEITFAITHPNPLYQLNSTEARVHVRIPKGYELKSLEPTEPPVVLLPLGPDRTERKEDEEKVIGDEQELVFTIPKYALPGYTVGWILELQQKDDAKVPCDPSKIKAFASDRVTGITCNGQACPTLPRLITSTTVEKNLINQRPALSFTDLNITSAAKSGKEELTIKYKLSNAVTTTNHAADLPATQQVKIDLYKDTNNNGRFDAADTKLSTTPYTFQEAVVEGASSSEKTITALVDQGDVCRLLLVINNDTNKCLCKDVYTQFAPPATLTNLVPNLTVCENETKKVAYNAAGASYDQYTWTGKTANDKLDYLSAVNVKEPNFHYNGIKLTATQTFTYVLTVKRTNGCEATQEVKLTVKPAPNQPTVAQDQPAGCGTVSTAKVSNHSSYAPGITFKVTKGGTPVSAIVASNGSINAISEAGTYVIKAMEDGCESTGTTFTIYAKKPIPVTPEVSQVSAAGCGTLSTAKVNNYATYPSGTTFSITTTVDAPVAGARVEADGTINGITTAGTYKVKATQGTCTSEETFTIADVLPVPATPTPTATQSFCNSATVADLAPQGTDIKWYDAATGGSLLTSTTALVHNNKYYAARTLGSCESTRAEVTVKIISLAQPTLVATAVPPTCTAEGKAKITNHDSNATYTFTKADGTAVTEPITIAADGIVTGLVAGSYKVKASKDGCEATSADFQIADKLPAPATPAPTATQSFCNSATVADLAPQGTDIKWYDAATGGSLLTSTTALVHNNKYYAARTLGSCESTRAEVTVKIISLAQPTLVATAVPPTCTAEGKAKITNHDSNATYTFTKADGTAVTEPITIAADGIVTGLVAGSYKVKASKDGCEATSASFVIQSKQAATTTTNPVGATYVKGATATPLSVTATGEGTLRYQWFEANSATATGTAVGSNSASYTPSTATVGSKFYYVEVTGTCGTVKSAVAEIKVTALAPTIVANDDPDTSVAKGGTVDILSNDRLNGNPVAPTDVAITIPDNGGITNLSADLSTGKLKVPTDATPGTYPVTYKICDKAHPGVCDTAVVKITVTGTPPPTIVANDDPDTSVAKGGTVDILSNDRLNGNPVVPTDVDITIPNNGGITNLSADPSTGKLKVPTDATPGTYPVTYKICDKAHPGVCDTAVVKITVTGTPPPTIVANDDPDTSVAKGGTVDILSNDRLNGNPVVPTDVDITIPNNGGITNLSADPSTGKLKVPTDATPATYDVEYRICVKGATSPCDTAKAKITVTPDATPSRAIKAVDDDFGKVPNTVDYTTTNTVFSTGVDTLEGVPSILSPETDVILHKGAVTRQDGTAVQAGTITMNDNGSITVKQGTPVGVYTYTYSICEKAVPTNCSEEAKVTFEVVDNTILAKDDEFEMGTSGGLTPSVLNNDIFAGKVGPTTNEVIIEKTSRGDNEDPKLKMGFVDGRVDVEKGIAPGIHKYYYTISDKNDKTKSSSAVVTIKVVTFTAEDDEHELPNNNDTKQYIDKSKGIFANDEVDGKRPEPGKNVTFRSTPVKDKDGKEVPGIVINQEDGSITIEPNTPDGVYTYSYTICKIAAPNECKTAKGVLKLLPALKAVDDLDFKPVNTTKGAVNVGNVLANDEYAGKNALDHLDKVTAKIEDNNGGISDVKIDEQGNLIIPQGTPVGVYDLEYNLCMKEHPGVCKTAKVRVEVIKDKPLTIYNGVSADGDGHNDYFKIDGIEYYPKNNLKIFNRWGVLVYEKDGYSNEAPFDGHSNGRATISADSKLPQGTYYYILEYEDSDDQSHTKKGWLYLKY